MELIVWGKITYIDDDKIHLIEGYNLGLKISGLTHYVSINKGRQIEKLHRFILMSEGFDLRGWQVDHKDRNGLNNVRDNLRICTSSQNCINISIRSNNFSGYKGVSWNKKMRKWSASITYHRIKMHLGYFNDVKDAANAYNKAALNLFKQFAWLNPIE